MVLLLKILSFVFCKIEKKVYDSRLTWPYSLLFCGPTGSGKTSFVLGLLKNHEILSTHTPHKLIWIYGVSQPELFREIRAIWQNRECEFIEGFPDDLLSRLGSTHDRGSLCVFDDVMDEVSSNAEVSKLFTCGRSHLGCSLILMLQNIFPNGKHSRTISINAQYQTLFCNPCDSLQISTLTRQLCPTKSRDFLEMYKKATKRPYGYLFCCFTQSCPDEIRFRTNILPDEHPIIVYQL